MGAQTTCPWYPRNINLSTPASFLKPSVKIKVDETGYEIGARKQEKWNRQHEYHNLRRLDRRRVQNLFPEEIVMIILRVLHTPVDRAKNRYFNHQHQKRHEAGKDPNQKLDVYIAHNLGSNDDRHDHRCGDNDICDRRADKLFQVPVFA